MPPQIYWFLWLLSFIVIAVFAHRKRRATGLTDEQIILISGFTSAGIFALIKVLMNVSIHYQALQEKIDWDGITAVTISCLLGITMGIKEIIKLIKP